MSLTQEQLNQKLHDACLKNDVQAALAAISSGADPFSVSAGGESVLYWFTLHRNGDAVCTLAQAYPALLHKPLDAGRDETAILHFGLRGDGETVLRLATIDPSILMQTDDNGQVTAATWLAIKGDFETVGKLAQLNPAILRHKSYHGETLAIAAAKRGKLEILQRMDALDGTALFETDNRGYTPIHWLAYNGCTNQMEALAKCNPKILSLDVLEDLLLYHEKFDGGAPRMIAHMLNLGFPMPENMDEKIRDTFCWTDFTSADILAELAKLQSK